MRSAMGPENPRGGSSDAEVYTGSDAGEKRGSPAGSVALR
jgi:hypothetical protein